jgi:hypothetical protein
MPRLRRRASSKTIKPRDDQYARTHLATMISFPTSLQPLFQIRDIDVVDVMNGALE